MIAATYNVHRCVGRDRVCAPDRIAKVIHELDADIVALQEVSDPDTIKRLVGNELIFGETMPGYGNAIVSRLPMRHVKALDLSVTRREPRGALHVVIDETLHVIAAHLGLKRAERQHQRNTIAAYAKDLAPLVVLGDFNEWAPFTFFGETAVLRSWPTQLPLFPLDRIWVRMPDAAPTFRVHRSPLAKIASDHYPVAVQLKP